jgi:hypothetical protein
MTKLFKLTKEERRLFMNVFKISDGSEPSQLPTDLAHICHFVNAIITVNYLEGGLGGFPDPKDPDYALYIYYWEEGDEWIISSDYEDEFPAIVWHGGSLYDEWIISSDYEDEFPAIVWHGGSLYIRNTVTGKDAPCFGIGQAVDILCQYYGIFDCECKVV